MQAIEANGASFHVAVDGPPGGPALVFSNSLGTDLRIWDPVLPLLPAGLRVLRYDKRGHGLSDCPEGPWTIGTHVADLAAIMDACGIRGAAVCGLSVGGLIAQGLAAERPELVGGLILCDTAAKIGTEAMWNDRIARVEAEGVAAIAEGILERWFTPAFREGDPSFPLWRNMLVRTPAAGYAGTCRAIRDADLTEATRGLGVPCLAICGSQDGPTPPDLVRATAELTPGGRFAEIPDCGHIPCVERPGAFAALLAGFLSETGLARP